MDETADNTSDGSCEYEIIMCILLFIFLVASAVFITSVFTEKPIGKLFSFLPDCLGRDFYKKICCKKVKNTNFQVTGAECDPDTGACYPMGIFLYCDSPVECWKADQYIWQRYKENISWVVHIPIDKVDVKEPEGPHVDPLPVLVLATSVLLLVLLVFVWKKK
jgi:hypothetical protein